MVGWHTCPFKNLKEVGMSVNRISTGSPFFIGCASVRR